MKTKLHILALTLAFSLQPSAFLQAASPLGTAFTYHGRLQLAGVPVSGSYDFLFRLHDAPIGDHPVGPLLSTNAVPVSDGLFLATLDFGEGVFTGEARWLQISVQTNGGERYTSLSPRQLLTPAPSAQYAPGAGSAAFAAMAGGMGGSNLTAEAEATLTLRAPSLTLESARFTNTVGGSASQVIGANWDEEVSGHLSITAGLTYHLTTGGDVTESFGRDRTTEVSSDYLLTVGGAHVLSTGKGLALEVGEDLTATCTKNAWVQAGDLLTLKADDEVWLQTGASSMQMKKNGEITIEGKYIRIKPSDKLVVKSAPAATAATFHSAASVTNNMGVGIWGESAATNGIGVFGLASSAALDQVQVGVMAVADQGGISLALLANCASNSLLPSNAVPRPAAIAGRARAAQDIIQGYGEGDALNFRVSDSGVVTATRFAGNGASLTGIGTGALADNSINSPKIADGSIGAVDLSPALASNTFWRLGGNAGTRADTHFVGTTDDQPLAFKVNGRRVFRLEDNGDGSDGNAFPDGAPNIIGGSPSNFVAAGVVGATIAGGGATNYGGLVRLNSVEADYGTVGGGLDNNVGAGSLAATIAGGYAHDIGTNSDYATIGGGLDNHIPANAAYATIPGGRANQATNYAFAAGYRAKANHTGAFVWADCTAADFASSSNNQFLIRATGGVGIGTNQPAGALHVVGDALVQGADLFAVDAARVQMGSSITVASGLSSVALGKHAIASGASSFAVGADSADASGSYSIAMGSSAKAKGSYSVALGPNAVAGDYSIALGTSARATNLGCFVWGDYTQPWNVRSTNDNSVTLRAAGGYRLFSNTGMTVGAHLPPGGNAWSPMSDRNVKENFRPVDPRAILEKVAALPLTEWNLISQPADIRHLGPMAQDFKAAFGLGESDRHISTSDADGVALAAIQGLNQKIEEQLKAKDATIATLEGRLAHLEELVNSLAQQKPNH